MDGATVGATQHLQNAATSGPFLTDEVDFSNTPDTYLAPLDQRYSAFVSGRQDLGASAEVFADILYTDRHTKTSTREDGFFQATSLSNTQTEQLPPPSSITQNDATAALITSDHSSDMAASPNYNTVPSRQSPKFAARCTGGKGSKAPTKRPLPPPFQDEGSTRTVASS